MPAEAPKLFGVAGQRIDNGWRWRSLMFYFYVREFEDFFVWQIRACGDKHMLLGSTYRSAQAAADALAVAIGGLRAELEEVEEGRFG